MSNFTYTSEASLGYMTATANRRLSAALRRKMKDAGIDLTSEQWGILVLLWNRGSSTQEELAQAACVDKSSMSRVLSLMEAKQLITRVIDPSNERRKIICSSQASLDLQDKAQAVALDVVSMALAGVKRQDCETCLKVLEAIKSNLRDSPA